MTLSNVVTEDEARRRHCPFARLSVREAADYDVPGTPLRPAIAAKIVNTAAHNRTPDSVIVCVASACMAWRWSAAAPGVTSDGRGPRGFCGLVSSP